MTKEAILIRVDSSSSLGIGHISRCLGLSQALVHQGKRVVYISKPLPGNINHQIKKEGYQVLEPPDDDIRFITTIAKNIRPKWIVLDHPETNLEYEKEIRSGINAPLAVIDGQYRNHDCDLLLNPNCYATEGNCASTVPIGCRILAGYKYFILRDEYLDHRNISTRESVYRILVTLGGADPERATLTVCRALEKLHFNDTDIAFDIVLGPANQHVSEIRSYLESVMDSRFKLHDQPSNLFSLITHCSLCISAGGITMGEIAYLEKPAIGMVMAENQKRTIETLAAKRAIVPGDLKRIGQQVLDIVSNQSAQKRLVSSIRGLVDGKGKYRIVMAMNDKVN